MIPLVILDLDGTVIGSTGFVEDCIWDAIEHAKAQGIRFAVCTGRPGFGVALQVATRLAPNSPHIFQNGAAISYPDGRNLNVRSLKEEYVLKLVKMARDNNLLLELYTPTNLFVERKTSIGDAHAKMIGVNAVVRDLVEAAKTEPVVRAQWVVDVKDEQRISDMQLAGLSLSHAGSPAMPTTRFISVTQVGINKGSAVLQLCEALSFNPAEVMAVGDSVGDIPMLEVVGYPRVMANAQAALKRQFPNVLGQVDACGLLPAIDEALYGAGG